MISLWSKYDAKTVYPKSIKTEMTAENENKINIINIRQIKFQEKISSKD
jgi:hypothetical protein